MPSREEGFVLRRAQVFDASPARLFEMVTDPSEIARWWGPHDFTTSEIDLDPRIGGLLSLRWLGLPG
jgi:uncharacterized protein YndB with AHSA1/START domain